MFSRDKKAREGVIELDRKFDELEHDFKMLKLEWEESYEKIASMLRKLGRRAEVLQKEMDGGKPPLSAEEQVLANDGGEPWQAGSGLTPKQKVIQQQILRRRAGMG